MPDTRRYPCFTWGAPLPLVEEDEDGEGPHVESMSAARVREDLPEILLAAYGGDRSRIFTFDSVHEAYLS